MIRRIAAVLAVVVLASLGLALQQPPVDESTLSDLEKRIPPGHYCKKKGVRISPRETRAHPCECTFACTVDEAGNIMEREDSTCQAWCKKNGRRCTCHVEEPCPEGHHNAVVDMDGHVTPRR